MNNLNPILGDSSAEGMEFVFEDSTDEMKSLISSIGFGSAAHKSHLAEQDLKIWLRKGQSVRNFYENQILGTDLKIVKVIDADGVVFVADRNSNKWDDEEVIP